MKHFVLSDEHYYQALTRVATEMAIRIMGEEKIKEVGLLKTLTIALSKVEQGIITAMPASLPTPANWNGRLPDKVLICDLTEREYEETDSEEEDEETHSFEEESEEESG